MTEQAKVPAIRFAGFTDPWEQRKLGDCFEFLKSNTLSRAGLNGENGTARNVHYGDILIKFGDCLDDERSDLPFITDDTVLPKYAGSILREGDVIFADTAEDETAGKCVELRKLPKEPTISGLHTIPARPRFPFGTGYLGHYLNSDAYHRQLLPLMQGIKVISVSKAALQDTQVRFPGLSEQSAIGAALNEIDSLITLHQRKYDKLVIFKKTMLEKMFPKDGESVPEIRFAGFTDPWEQRKLVEVATFGGGHTPPMADPDNYEDGYVLWVTSQDVKSNYLDRTTTQITEKGAKELTLYPAGSLVMVTRSGILRHTLPVAELRKPSTVNQDIRVILPQGECCGEWLLQFFISHNKELLLEFGKTGTTVESVDFGKIKDMLLYMPSTVEQQQIGDFFAKLDSLITLHQRKLELLRNIKKSLLDKMFV
ncbi:restriction endonuclease subunit S [Bifidobacterium bifidum]|uniref:restriction endonuclease subunit S n=2 Tax=Bifidobacterium bifidum TaxID=1681 RepID=UPI0023310E45|nr:restriction endonuclease subunit S [Bifidobacterium bifidum]MDB1240616.1 restriction endonuclease subunit S [Bifidobacterium bifidum]